MMKRATFSKSRSKMSIGLRLGLCLCIPVLMCFIIPAPGPTGSVGLITVKVNEIKATIQPTMWGIFFEDINLGADGGIYAELVKNRSFEFNKPMLGWTVLGKPLTEGDFL